MVQRTLASKQKVLSSLPLIKVIHLFWAADPLPQNFAMGLIHRLERHEIPPEPVLSFENLRMIT
jgi:hypothetical protein